MQKIDFNKATKKDLKIINKFMEEINNPQINQIAPYTTYLINKEKGFLEYIETDKQIELINIYIKPEYRKNKYAHSLIKYLINLKFKRIILEVNENNKSAIDLYKKNNFNIIAKRKNYYKGTETALIMERRDMKDIYILAIESSCDETSVSIVKNGNKEINTTTVSQIEIHKLFGGVVPEIASRTHVKTITIIIEECLKKSNMKIEDITAIACTYGPGLVGSLLVGIEAAKTLAYIYDKPLIPVHHLSGHIYANNLSSEMEFPLIALLISGGHTELIYMKENYSYEKIGGTIDDAIGETYDKVARVLGIGYPGGPELDRLAALGIESYMLPLPLADNSLNFSFSGLKSAVINLVHNKIQKDEEINKQDLATTFQNVIIKTLTTKTLKALKEYKVNNLIIAGGVSANKGIRKAFQELSNKEKFTLKIPEIKYCTDNATMIAASGYYAFLKGKRAGLDLRPASSERIN